MQEALQGEAERLEAVAEEASAGSRLGCPDAGEADVALVTRSSRVLSEAGRIWSCVTAFH